MARLDETKSTERVFSILHLFRADTTLGYDLIASLLDESVEEAKRDVALFIDYEAGLDILHFIDIEPTPELPTGGIYVLDDLPLERPLRLSGPETDALLAALDCAEVDAHGALSHKLQAAWNAGDGGEVGRLVARMRAGTVEQRMLEDLAFYVEKKHLVWIDYCKTGDTCSRRRLVEPQRLYLSVKGAWYLDAFCRSACAPRTFKVERISRVEDATGHFQPRPDLDASGRPRLEGLEREVPAHLDDAPRVLLRVPLDEDFQEADWPGMEERSRAGDGFEAGSETDPEDGFRLISVPVGGLEWMARHIAARLGRIEVVEPEWVADAVRTIARATLAE